MNMQKEVLETVVEGKLDIYSLAALCPKAYLSLPECYQGDNCLEFEKKDAKLFAKPAKGQEHLGTWEAVYNTINSTWECI